MNNGYSGNSDNENEWEKQQRENVRYCTECGCRLASGSQFAKCDDCRRREADRNKKGLWALVGVIGLSSLSILSKIIGGSSKNR